ncbi:MAG TPA: hypothetical protein VIJ15_11515 [Dermatophilaceae bacterium]
MSFQEKITLALTGILLAVFGGYFALVLGEVAGSPAHEVAYRDLMVPVVIALVIVVAVVHVANAAISHADADLQDERDRQIGLRGERTAGYVLAAGTVAGLSLAMAGAETFWVAQALLGTLVLAELTEDVTRLTLYRRGAGR